MMTSDKVRTTKTPCSSQYFSAACLYSYRLVHSAEKYSKGILQTLISLSRIHCAQSNWHFHSCSNCFRYIVVANKEGVTCTPCFTMPVP